MASTFDKVLVANRGEIAVRIIRTLRELGMRSVAVFSDADRKSMHVARADEAYRIGPAPLAESYLNIDRILEAAKQCGANAIHPGYGFLSENPSFARACAAAGIVFIGPSPEAMEKMGNKMTARETMAARNVPVVPGAGKPLVKTEDAIAQANEIGYPVLLKAASGGGGKGMRIVRAENDLAAALERTRGEAGAAFGDDTVFLEKYVDRPRHIEVQILGDTHGNVVHLGERECSVQRRFQKLIEESPSPFVDEELRARLGASAVEAARAVDYVGAGTVEFVMSQQHEFYFLEMNTRLQVEHPVTELITGLDLVREQVQIAAGEPLSFTQEEVRFRGHAIEFRVNAEDPSQGFLPAAGYVTAVHFPQGPGVRNDAGFYAGYEIPTLYDPLLAKLIVWAGDRDQCLQRARRAIHEYSIKGIRHNLPFHLWTVHQEDFVAGNYDTHFIDRTFTAESLAPTETEEDLSRIAAAIRAWRDRDHLAVPEASVQANWKWIARRDGMEGG